MTNHNVRDIYYRIDRKWYLFIEIIYTSVLSLIQCTRYRVYSSFYIILYHKYIEIKSRKRKRIIYQYFSFYLTRWNKSSSHNMTCIYIYSIMRHKFWGNAGNCIESIRNFHRKWLENGGKSPEKYVYVYIEIFHPCHLIDLRKTFQFPLTRTGKNEYLDTNFLPKFFTLSLSLINTSAISWTSFTTLTRSSNNLYHPYRNLIFLPKISSNEKESLLTFLLISICSNFISMFNPVDRINATD